ncbi:Hypothetical predicted protein [Mytilus galloprovincialis]|uniref:Uncharacterized protein n=1 Tax=Mytilus galloprovincialis TaxID=29158 RepID=A0A8B6ETD1_MYTGA|nr:Hypothetical predicted protein [Mytilus galloprovincialis]
MQAARALQKQKYHGSIPDQDDSPESSLHNYAEQSCITNYESCNENAAVEQTNNLELSLNLESESEWDLIDQHIIIESHFEDEIENIDCEASICEDLVKWVNENNISHNATDQLLKILKSHGMTKTPATARSLLKTKRNIELVTKAGMEYFYFGLEKGFLNTLNKYPDKTLETMGEIVVSFNIDGLPLFKSTKTSLWPILCGIHAESFPVEVFPVSICLGGSKPDNLNFMDEFIEKLYSGYYGCDKCAQTGVWVGRMTYQEIDNVVLRTDESFRNQCQLGHHHRITPLMNLPIDMIKTFPIDYMHQVCLGVMKRLFLLWLKDDFDKALERRARSINTSNVDTNEEDGVEQPREVRPPLRLLNDHSDSEDSHDEDDLSPLLPLDSSLFSEATILIQEYSFNLEEDQQKNGNLKVKTWIDDMRVWPNMMYGEIYNFLVESKAVDGQQMENFNSLQSFNYFQSGNVGVTTHYINNDKTIMFKGEVRSSLTVSRTNEVIVLCSEDGSIVNGWCSCMAGQGHTRSHVGAVLWKIEHAVRTNVTGVACTDENATWNRGTIEFCQMSIKPP